VSALLRSNLVVAAGTTLSRITGLLRVAVFVYVIGRTALADVYTIANETPNIVYDLLIGGVLSATLVPLFSSFLERDDEESTNVVVTTAVVVMTGLTVVAVLAAPLIFGIYSITPSGDVDADTLRQAGTTLTRIFLVQILFYGLAGVANAFLNSRRRFFAAAWSPIVANLVIIATLLSLPDPGTAEWQLGDVLTDARLRWTLGLGATVGIAAMALILVPAVLRTGFRFRPVWNLRHPAVRKLLTLSGWTVGFVAANQLTLIVVRNLAEPGSGDAAAYFFAFTFFVLPHGLLAVSISTTFQPEMALSVARRDRAGFIHHASLGTRMVALLTLPAGVLMFVLREPIIGFALQRGAFDAADTLATSRALAGFAVGLVGFSVYMFVLRGFYAHQDTRTPFIVNLAENALNIVFAFVLVGRYGVLGLGLAFAVAYLMSAAWVLRILSYKVPGFPLRYVALSIGRMGLAALLMAEIVWLVSRRIGGTTGTEALARLAVGAIVGVVAYVGILLLLRAPEVVHLRQLTVRLRRPPK
jgi:putative peptidoglycan lipid II flippase